jgi:hypothetical protein
LDAFAASLGVPAAVPWIAGTELVAPANRFVAKFLIFAA